jgi:hypothetical protein
MVNGLMKRLRARSKVEVVRRGLVLLQETTDRAALREAYARASRAVRSSTVTALGEMDHLSNEGLDKGKG